LTLSHTIQEERKLDLASRKYYFNMADGNEIVLTSQDNSGILKVIFNRPHRKNAWTFQSYERLIEILSKANADDTVKCIILTGAGDFFSSGADIGPDIKHDQFKIPMKAGEFMSALLHCEKFLVGVVNGPAVGLAAAILGLCDIVYASETAFFWTPFFELALVPECCSSILFPQIMGPSRAAKMLYAGKRMRPHEAKVCGFIADYFPPEKLMQKVENELKTNILQKPLASKSIKMFKNLIRGDRMKELEQSLQKELFFLVERVKNGELALAVSQRGRKRRSKL